MTSVLIKEGDAKAHRDNHEMTEAGIAVMLLQIRRPGLRGATWRQGVARRDSLCLKPPVCGNYYSSPGKWTHHPIHFTTGGGRLCVLLLPLKMLPTAHKCLSVLQSTLPIPALRLWSIPLALASLLTHHRVWFFKALLKASALIRLKLWYFRVAFCFSINCLDWLFGPTTLSFEPPPPLGMDPLKQIREWCSRPVVECPVPSVWDSVPSTDLTVACCYFYP